jgi:LCP family protein required for cell wall assembly
LAIGWAVITVLIQSGARFGRQPLVITLAVIMVALAGGGAWLSQSQASSIDSVFASGTEASLTTSSLTPHNIMKAERVNILLLGYDSGQGNFNPIGPSTDTIMVASINPATGATVLLSLPGNTARMPFPDDPVWQTAFPKGWFDGTTPSNPDFYLSSMYSRLPASTGQHQIGATANLGADSLKLSVGTALGLTIDYYVLINLTAMADLIDAIGGVTININKPIPIPGGNVAAGTNRHLDGATALAYVRSRQADDDYHRMARQRCLAQGVLAKTSLLRLLASFPRVSAAATTEVSTDIPVKMLPSLATIAQRVKDGTVIGLQFTNNENGFIAARPNFQNMALRVSEAISLSNGQPNSQPSTPPIGSGTAPRLSDPLALTDFCTFDPDADW